MAALALAAATAVAAEPPPPAALKELAPTGAKASGLVGQSIARAGLRGVTVAP